MESWIAKADFKIGEEEITKGTWLMTVEVTDNNVWEGILKGEITGLSMGGLGNYSEEDVDLDNVEKQENSEKKGLLKQLAKALGLGVVEKGAMAEIYEARSKSSLFWNAFNSLEEVLHGYNSITGTWQYETDETTVREALDEFTQIITEILTGTETIAKAIQTGRPIENAGKKMSSKNKERLADICDSLQAFLKDFDDPDDEEKNPKKKGDTKGKEGDNETDDPDPDDGVNEPEKKPKTDKEDKEVTKQEVEQIVTSAIEKALKTPKTEETPEAEKDTNTIGKKKETDEKVEKSADTITPEAIESMVEAAIKKATEPPEEHVTAEQVGEMITEAVEKALEPVLRSRGLPSNLNGSNVEKSAEGTHYLHGIL